MNIVCEKRIVAKLSIIWTLKLCFRAHVLNTNVFESGAVLHCQLTFITMQYSGFGLQWSDKLTIDSASKGPLHGTLSFEIHG